MAKINNPNINKGKTIHKTKNIAPKTMVSNKYTIPTIIVKNLIKKPIPREIALNAKYSKNFFKSSPRGLLVISLLHGEIKVFNNKGMEK